MFGNVVYLSIKKSGSNSSACSHSVHPPPHPPSRDHAPGSQVNRGQDLPANKPPQDWPWAENPPDIYFNYYVWANLHALNGCRHARGLNSFQYHPRPSPAVRGDCVGWSYGSGWFLPGQICAHLIFKCSLRFEITRTYVGLFQTRFFFFSAPGTT